MVEHSPEKAGVDSSILSLGTTKPVPLTSSRTWFSFPSNPSKVIQGDRRGCRNVEGLDMPAQRNREEACRLLDRVRGKPSTFIPYRHKQTVWNVAKGLHADRFAAAGDGGKQLDDPARKLAHSASDEDRQ